jgi:ketosteroid isomerase-like protein
MKKTLLVLVAMCSALAFAQTTPSVAPMEADIAITKLREGLVDSFVKGDIDRLVTYLAPEVVVTWQNGEVSHGPAGVRAYYQRMMTGENRVVREIKAAPQVLGRHVSGDTAISWGNLHDSFVLNDGRELPFNTVFTLTTAKRGDRWLVTSYHASVSVFENPVLSLATRKVGLWVGGGAVVIGLLLGWFIGRSGKRHATS